MTAENFKTALSLVLVHEGGFSDHPADPGGATMKGVTQKVYDNYRTKKGEPPRPVKRITVAELEEIYRRQYWAALHADDMPSGLDYCLFDYAVNSGPGRAAKDLQRALGVNADGIIGMATLRAAGEADDGRLINDICDRRLRFLKSLKTWKTFGRGWEERVRGVRQAALSMVQGDEPVLAAPPPAELEFVSAKAPEAAQAQLKTAEGAGLSLTAAGAGGEKVRQIAEGLQPHMGLETILGRIAFVVFTLLMLIGGVLIGYAYLRRIKEKGGLGGFVGSVFKGAA